MDSFFQSLLGYRIWIVDEEGLLHSTGLGAGAWPGALLGARCRRNPSHAAPEGSCSCGIYGLHDLHVARAHRRSMILFLGQDEIGNTSGEADSESLRRADRKELCGSGDYLVLGSIAGGGRVEIEWECWRAERARITGFLLSPGQWDSPLRTRLQERYGASCWKDPEDFRRAAENGAIRAPDIPPAPFSEETLGDVRRGLRLAERGPDSAPGRPVGVSPAALGELAVHFGFPPPG